MHEELYGGPSPDYVRKLGNGISFPETLTSQQEMAGVIRNVLDALDASDLQPATEAEMKRLAAVCQSWGYGAVCKGTKEQVAAILSKKIWAQGARRIKAPPFGPFGPESVQKAKSCQMERKCQFLTGDSRDDPMVFSQVVGKSPDSGWWFAGVTITASDAPVTAPHRAPASVGFKSTSPESRSTVLAANNASPGDTITQLHDKGADLSQKKRKWWEFWK